jgi:uncharacterized caspase-like protein
MAKVALLIGVGEYLPSSGLQNLAAAARDVAAMRDVLVQPEIGGFAEADVTVLLNPEPQQTRMALNQLFVGRKRDDLLVFYFSGHGWVDNSGNFYFTSPQTDKKLLDATAISASFVHGLMEARGSGHSERQVVILDCCFSGAFAKDMKAKGEAVNLQPQLGGKGRAVLTSSSATEYSFEQKEAELSVYTQYVVEGLRTGIADGDGDGWISVDELHGFAQGKVREVAPAMQPKIYAVEEGYKIRLAQAPVGDPRLEYRKEVEILAEQRQGSLSTIVLMALETKQRQWGLDEDVASTIRQEVLRPYKEFAAKLQTYHQALQQELQQGNQLAQEKWEDLQYLQQALGLKDENIQSLMQDIQILPEKVELLNAITQNELKPRWLIISIGMIAVIGLSFWGGQTFEKVIQRQLIITQSSPAKAINVVEDGNQVSGGFFKNGLDKQNKKVTANNHSDSWEIVKVFGIIEVPKKPEKLLICALIGFFLGLITTVVILLIIGLINDGWY